MNASNANDPGGGSNTITLATGVSGTITLSAVLRPTMNVTILGPGAPVLTISGNPAVRLFQIAGIVFTLQDVTLSGGRRAAELEEQCMLLKRAEAFAM